jgi:hypothetical protein
MDHIFAAELAWVLGAQRPQANADAEEAMRWLNTELPGIQQLHSDNNYAIDPDAIAACLDSGSITTVFQELKEWLHQGLSVAHFINMASSLCARRFARLSLNNGGLWRDATRGMRLCVHLRSMCQHYSGPFQVQSLFVLAFHLFETRWLQHRAAWDDDVHGDVDWAAFSDAVDALDVRRARDYLIAGYVADPDAASVSLVAQIIRDDLDYEQLATLAAVLNEVKQQQDWQPYLAGLITYAIDQRSSRNSLAAAQFGNSFTSHHTGA